MPSKRLLQIFFSLMILAVQSGCLESLSPEDRTLFSKVYGNGGFSTAIDIVQDSTFGGYWILGAELEEEDNDSLGTRVMILKVNNQGIQIDQPDTILLPGESFPIKMMLRSDGSKVIFGNTIDDDITRNYRVVFTSANAPILLVDTVDLMAEDVVNDFNFHNNHIIATGYHRFDGDNIRATLKYYDANTLALIDSQELNDNAGSTGEKIVLQERYNDFAVLINTDRGNTGEPSINIAFHVFFEESEAPVITLPIGSAIDDYVTGYLTTYDAANVQTVYAYGYTRTLLEADNTFIVKTNGQNSPDQIIDADKKWFKPSEAGFKVFEQDEVSRRPYDLIKLDNNDLLMAGISNDDANRVGDDIFLMRLGSNGEMLWERWLPFGGQENETLCKIKLEADGSVLVLSTLVLNDNSSVISLSRMRVPLKL